MGSIDDLMSLVSLEKIFEALTPNHTHFDFFGSFARAQSNDHEFQLSVHEFKL